MRPQTLGEEIANSVSHGVGLAAAAVAMPFLVASAGRRGGPAAVAGAGVFAATVLLLYLVSTLYHALPGPRTKRVFRVIDHSAIFLLIAGTYTPFALVSLRGPWGWTLLGIVWGLALLGIAAKAAFGARWPIISTALYLGMGWVVLVAAKPLVERVPPGAIALLVAGGLAYTGGVAFYAWTRLRYGHAIWHLFVIAGSVCHYLAVVLYVV